MKSTIQDKTNLVNSVFSEVHEKYDLMNDILSFGAHRIWKDKFIDWMNPQPNTNLIDVASGTGDVAKLFYDRTKKTGKITCAEPNSGMLKQGKKKLMRINTVSWIHAPAEKLTVNDNSFDYYSISFGIRNVSNIHKAFKEAFRVLKPGGRFMCLEFSKINNEILNLIYQQYSRAIPFLGKLIVGSDKPYNYLIKSIDEFYNQDQLAELIKNNGFSNVEFRNMANGISAIHSGWKI